MTSKLKILFLCTGNSCRSQMAEGWAKKLHSDSWEVYSAGIEAHGLNPYAVKVMAEVGVDISSQESNLVENFLDIGINTVITVCSHADKNCPIFPENETEIIHHPFEDPPALAKSAKTEEETLNIYRKVRDEIRDYITDFKSS